ncbi:MAG TPA: carbamoyltransferase HypF [Acidimicrobiales bacterium]|nr:carbamoyltransferase HypF [Acidimicrobiales bacterium]
MIERRRLRVTGTVQGVGFRPFVYRHAVALGLSGSVGNDTAGVVIDVAGSPDALAELCRVLVESPPPLASVTGVEVLTAPADAGDDRGGAQADGGAARPRFRIVESAHDGTPDVAVGVDGATCPACLAEVDDPGDRRHRYPFTNCTACGPRYTIVLSVPYDRPATTMAGFAMCRRCQAEYDDPADRRFHAQPNACPVCGPRLTLRTPAGAPLAEGDDALAGAVDALRTGRIVGIKGVGGYHLAVDATDAVAVAELRRRKARDDKPFAVLVADLASAEAACHLDAPARAVLCSARRPIVLAPRREDAALAPGVAPGLAEVGVMLPYSPLHHLLSLGVGRAIVLTSGNLSDDPIAHRDDDAVARLGPMVDALLTHDRPIHIRCDDSVVRAANGRTQMVRRSRGYAPEPIRLPWRAQRQVLAVGAERKNTVSVAKGERLVTSHHIGDLEHLATYGSFLQATRHLPALYGVTPEVVAHDLHPEYLSTKWALDGDLDTLAVQHHHAHIASCLAEHGRSDTVLGMAFDGLGLGPDGTLWGGELLVADLGGYERVGHLRPVALPGGTAAVLEPWRMALSWVATACGETRAAGLGPALDPRWAAVLGLLEAPGASRTTSSAGRLFDAVAALVGVRGVVTYEGQAAVELEALARRVEPGDGLPLEVAAEDVGGLLVLDPAPLVRGVLDARDAGVEPAHIAAGFHDSFGAAAAEAAARLAARRGLRTVALSGGVFQNARLGAVVAEALRCRGLEVLVHEVVPPNDGGISVGQAAVAALGGSPAPAPSPPTR